ncbi:MAG: aldehyde dehydrogenase (NADP(+)) [Saprospiraceae bacterium]|nr:aldehyde dehydrogenase (NADP(+)) [Saprospiraceae bacterium]
MILEINKIMEHAQEAFLSYQQVSGSKKKEFLYSIAEEIESLGDELLHTASEESHLPFARFVGERGRTCSQLRAFGDLVGEGSWVEAVIDQALPDRQPQPRPDMRKMSISLGPILVFGASNFPLAYSTAGGDTASALAAGCPVVVKGHPSHPRTSRMVSSAIQKAVGKCGLHSGVFQHVEGASFELGKLLTQHPLTAGVGFTGSLTGGRAIFDYAQQREVPIPVFSEMGSTNPVIVMKDALNHRSPEMAKAMAASITIGVGQFCTNPGIILGIKSSVLNHFTSLLAIELSLISSYKMLNEGISENYDSALNKVLQDKGVETIYHAHAEGELMASPVLARVHADHFIQNPEMHHEIFGPFSVIVVCENKSQLLQVWSMLKGQLTTTLMATDHDLEANKDMVDMARNIAGRIVFNGVPTGVEVTNATVHGGPYPAATDARFTSVGMDAIKRWVRPLCYQDCPDFLLPVELQNANPMGILRKTNGVFSRQALIP